MVIEVFLYDLSGNEIKVGGSGRVFGSSSTVFEVLQLARQLKPGLHCTLLHGNVEINPSTDLQILVDDVNGRLALTVLWDRGHARLRSPVRGQAFAAIKSDGSVVTWGDAGRGGDSSLVANLLSLMGQW
eukprot:TRINITY_DN11819_c0_g1_i4.p1 TRINITY_DN11819_c0_g1~~TRINITY_DN11819_c0_g1_i4.p1  ORF type:complete len:129 (+),score=24.53 TRINITY_DN11819_c0_g1_i4:207-593(+)